ncbi:MAG: hypothetical protein AAGG48_02690 [Planctomycetota bacterium]
MIHRFFHSTRRLRGVVCLLIGGALFALPVDAQVALSPSLKDKTEPAEPASPVKTLTVTAAAQPDPMLRYRFWPAPETRRQQNPAALISRAVLLATNATPEAKKRFNDYYVEWSDVPLSDLPVDEARKVLAGYESSLLELQRAENFMVIDYDLHLDGLTANELIQTLLPEFQEMRQLGRLLHLRARVAVIEGRWEDAVHDIRVGFRLAEFAGHSTDFLVGRLVGFAIGGLMMNVVEEAIQQPGCPNMYWALSGLPAERLFETKQALEFESVLMARLFQFGDDLPDEPIGSEAAREKIKQLIQEANRTLMSADVGNGIGSTTQLMAGVYVISLTEPSRELLAGTAEWNGRVDQLSSAEAVLRATLLKFARVRDRWVAWSTLPDEAWDEYEEERKAAFSASKFDGDVLISLVNMLLPAVEAARKAGFRTQQQHHFLATVEALRMHASKTGELPQKLDGLRPVPAWSDALSGNAFDYQRISPTEATLIRTPRYPNDPETNFSIKLRGTK